MLARNGDCHQAVPALRACHLFHVEECGLHDRFGTPLFPRREHVAKILNVVSSWEAYVTQTAVLTYSALTMISDISCLCYLPIEVMPQILGQNGVEQQELLQCDHFVCAVLGMTVNYKARKKKSSRDHPT
eukprot:Blabericola_migrator_1__2567@NODE_1724_length_3921_cov_660_524131_g1114_i0_p4_GENE_NODE_1724_length_3921_cov_660_524131_g1114_i0NODE_1724_length_3921_cov_660_524131_g1114_i0_p4_ORF_typecomplete_len130_score14_32_NODE_1724_length_3921_cov_660_524131_g1114_i0545934